MSKDYYVTDNTVENNHCYWICMSDRGKIIVEYDTHTFTECMIRHIAHTCGRSGRLAIILQPWLPKSRKVTIRNTVYTFNYPSWYVLKMCYPRDSKIAKKCGCKVEYTIKKGMF